MDKDIELQKLGEEANALMLTAKEAANQLESVVRQLDSTLGRVYYVDGHRFYKEFGSNTKIEYKNGRLKLLGGKHEIFVEINPSEVKKLAYELLASLE